MTDTDQTTEVDIYSKPMRARKSRIMLVQALYQKESSGCTYQEISTEFTDLYLTGAQGRKADKKLFAEVLTYLENHEEAVEEQLNECLAPKWSLPRVEAVLRAILLCGGTECIIGKTPPAVIINEYIQITSGFFNNDENKLVNAALDAMLKTQI